MGKLKTPFLYVFIYVMVLFGVASVIYPFTNKDQLDKEYDYAKALKDDIQLTLDINKLELDKLVYLGFVDNDLEVVLTTKSNGMNGYHFSYDFNMTKEDIVEHIKNRKVMPNKIINAYEKIEEEIKRPNIINNYLNNGYLDTFSTSVVLKDMSDFKISFESIRLYKNNTSTYLSYANKNSLQINTFESVSLSRFFASFFSLKS